MLETSQLMERFAIANSCFAVDVDAYSKAVSESFSSPADAFAHYQHSGRSALPELFPFIDPDYYAKQLVQQIPDTITPFEHYVTQGAQQGVSPMPLFDPQYVRSQEDELPFDDIFDFLSNPKSASLDPHPLFSKRYYNSINVDVANAKVDPFSHFVRYGWREKRPIHPFFGAEEYRRFEFPPDCNRIQFNEYLASAFESPALSLMQPLFDALHYLQSLDSNEDVTRPLQHYLTTGWLQNASAFPLFNQAFFLAQTPKIRSSLNPYIEYLSDFSHVYSPNEFFDPAFYLQSARVDSAFRGSLLEHFVRFGAADGAGPHRLVAITNAHPGRYSGFDPVRSFTGTLDRQFWLCAPTDDRSLASSLNEICEAEPALPRNFLNLYTLHPYSGPIGKNERSLIAVTRKCARCNCLVVSHSVLNEDSVLRLFSPSASLVSNARPWLTLVSCSTGTIRYSHAFLGCKAVADFLLPGKFDDKLFFIAQALVASIPNKLVVKTEPFGVALLRKYGTQILAAIPEVSLLVEGNELEPDDQQWLSEYIAMNYSELRLLIRSGTSFPSLTNDTRMDPHGGASYRVIDV